MYPRALKALAGVVGPEWAVLHSSFRSTATYSRLVGAGTIEERRVASRGQWLVEARLAPGRSL